MEHINTFSWVIIFTDLKDFTLKTSLLTQKQIDKLLDDQDNIIVKSLHKYNGTLIKTIWDSYMMFFEDIKNSILFAIEIQNTFFEYNKNVNIKLKEIEIRIALDYGNVNKKNTINWYDYFWDCVNLASRVLSKTLENKIFITNKFYDFSKDLGINIRFNFIWNTHFKWILYEVWVYEIIYKEEDIVIFDNWNNKFFDYWDILINDKTKIRYKNIDDVIFKSSAVNAVLWVQPIPFFDIYSSITVYIYMLKEIAKEYNIELNRNQIKEILVTIFTAIWWVLAINQAINWVWKIWLIWIAWFLLVPLNFWTTYWIWKVMNRYFYNSTKDINLTNAEIKDLFLSGKDYGIKYAKKNKKEILKIWKDLKKDFIEITKKSKDNVQITSIEIENKIKDLKN